MASGENFNKGRVLVIAVYSHIEAYPPSLNALYQLAPLFDKVYIVVRNIWVSEWKYPANVELITSGAFVSIDNVRKLSIFEKARSYVEFGFLLRRIVTTSKPVVVLLYDTIAFSIFNLFTRNKASERQAPIVWYHSHDVTVEHEVGKFSLMRLMKKLELRYFKRSDFFSLPNRVRLKFFPIHVLKREPFIIPNYPSRFFYGKWKAAFPENGAVRLIFQGHISESHKIENFIGLLRNPLEGKKIELHLAGPISLSYRNQLTGLAEKLNVKNRLFIYGRLPYNSLPDLTARCHIGLAMYGTHNTMVRTMSTASNKIFEYASVGLPVMVNLREDLKNEFKHYDWIRFVDDNDSAGMGKELALILKDYKSYSNKARMDFEEKLNFEVAFNPILCELKEELTRR
jgi:glycosyltransferase involved in cell wall biosynthesis